HAQRNGALSIAAGTPGFARYVHFSRPLPTWKLRMTEDGKRVALAQTQAVLEVPLTAAQAKGNSVTLHFKSPVKQTVRATAAGKASAAMPVNEGWQTVSIALPAGALVEGENRITLGFANSGKFGDKKASAAVEWIDIGAASTATAPPVVGDDKGLSLPKNGGLAYFVQIPAGGALVAHVEGAGCGVHVTAADAFLSPNLPELAKPSVILFSPSTSAPGGSAIATVCQPSFTGIAADALPLAVARTVCFTGDLKCKVTVSPLACAAVSGTSSTACVCASATRLPSSTSRSFHVGSGREKCT
ncbi:MAG TPA: hypothetical protein VIA18_09625, partial [Polyangia bacterium]|nr:hypothetical protein [Polyangia bacterium]